MKNDFFSRGRSVSDLKAHLTLTTKYRKKLFTKEMLERLHEIFEDLLGRWDCRVIEFNGEENHVHLLFQYHPSTEGWVPLALSHLPKTTSSPDQSQSYFQDWGYQV